MKKYNVKLLGMAYFCTLHLMSGLWNAGEYAWKAIMVHTVLLERGFVYWADAGARFRTASALTDTLDYVKRNGFASRNSSGKVKDWCHVKQLEYLDANKPRLLKQPNCDASGIGFTLRRCSLLSSTI